MPTAICPPLTYGQSQGGWMSGRRWWKACSVSCRHPSRAEDADNTNLIPLSA
jgi:hypothetical protein